MKRITFFLIISFLARYSFAQEEDTTVSYPTVHYIGLNMVGVANTLFSRYSDRNLSLKYVADKQRVVYNFSVNYRFIDNRRYKMLSFIDSDSNLVTRNYYMDYSKIDVRFGSAMKNKFGLGSMILGLDLIVGYATLKDNLIEYKIQASDTMFYGTADSLSIITTTSYPGMDYGNLGLDISLAYQLNLGDNFSLNLEYAPEVNFNYLIKKRGDIHSSEYDYSDSYLDVAFNRFYLILLYKF